MARPGDCLAAIVPKGKFEISFSVRATELLQEPLLQLPCRGGNGQQRAADLKEPPDSVLALPAGWAGEYHNPTFVIVGIDRDIVTIMVGECKLCRLASGICTTGMRKTHDRTDPMCRLHGVTTAASGPARDRSRTPCRGERKHTPADAPQGAGGNPSSSSASPRPLSEMRGFRTRKGKGVVLLYDPEPLDVWIDKEIKVTAEGKQVHAESGKLLTKQERGEYKAFLKRHAERNEDARQADKLFHICDKYLPQQADETRAFVARYPTRARTLLPKVRKIRDRLRREGGPSQAAERRRSERGEAGTESRGSDPQSSAPTPLTARNNQDGTTTAEDTDGGDDKSPTLELRAELPAEAHHSKATSVRKENEGSQPRDDETPPDWGDESQTDEDTAHNNRGEDAACNKWPWGEQGRPSDLGRSEGVLGQRPSEPAGKPQGGGVQLRPNRMWQAVRDIQAHMEQARRYRGEARERRGEQ